MAPYMTGWKEDPKFPQTSKQRRDKSGRSSGSVYPSVYENKWHQLISSKLLEGVEAPSPIREALDRYLVQVVELRC